MKTLFTIIFTLATILYLPTTSFAQDQYFSNEFSCPGSGVGGEKGLDGEVNSLKPVNIGGTDYVLASGDFTKAGALLDANRMALFNKATKTWSGLGKGLDGSVKSSLYDDTNNRIWAVGDFTQATQADGITTVSTSKAAYFDVATSTWHKVGNGITGTNDAAKKMRLIDNQLFIVGDISEVENADNSKVSVDNVAVFDIASSTWVADPIRAKATPGHVSRVNDIVDYGSSKQRFISLVGVFDSASIASTTAAVANKNIAVFTKSSGKWDIHSEGLEADAEVHTSEFFENDMLLIRYQVARLGYNANITDMSVVNKGTFYKFYVDWGDGNADTLTTAGGTLSHTYAIDGVYPVSVRVENSFHLSSSKEFDLDVNKKSGNSFTPGLETSLALVVGGEFSTLKTSHEAAPIAATKIGAFNSSLRHVRTFGVPGNEGVVGNKVTALARTNNSEKLYIGGRFDQAKDDQSKSKRTVATRNLVSFSKISKVFEQAGSGIEENTGATKAVQSLNFDAEGNLFVGGAFTRSGGKEACNCADYARENPGSLPVTLSGFEGKQVDNHIELNWATLTEVNNDYFALERQNENQEFVSIGEHKSAGNSQERQEYNHIDLLPMEGPNVYRLVQYDLDGTRTVVALTEIYFEDTRSLVIFGNLVDKTLRARIDTETSEQLTVTDMNGRQVMQLTAHDGEVQTDVSHLAPGLYILTYEDEKTALQQKFIKQ